jgi:hypothetical protein
MEMEPVSRHLGRYLIDNKDEVAYCVFVSTFLDINVINDFRGRKVIGYFDPKTNEHVADMKIIPVATAELRTILERGIRYDRLYSLFERAYQSSESVPMWYEREIINAVKC